ncbi:MAG: hypothetical protein E7Z92_02160 [Cyanobacteria bacterium SIG31]|nr:hypothetical protein [Cyanobacteria bacterium SIG31]
MRFLTTLAFLFISLFFASEALAVQEVVLKVDGEVTDTSYRNFDDEDDDTITDDEWYFDMGGKTLEEKIREILAREHKDISKSHYLLEEVLTKKFDNSLVKTMHVFAYYRAGLNMDFMPDDEDLYYDINNIDLGVNGKFRDGKTYYEARLRFAPKDGVNFLQYLPSNFYIANTAIPHHTIIVGNTRTATGYEGAKSSTVIPTIVRSQISRTFGNTRQIGTRIKGNYSLVEYDFGGYSSDTNFSSFFPGGEFAGWVSLKPLGKTNGKYGKLKMGSGLTAGQNNIDYTVLGAYASYEYKNLYANFEWGKADGYNGGRGLSSNKAEGLYTTLAYRLTPKLQLVGRYDQFKPNLDYSADIRREYTAGLNYFIKGQALKLMLNYVFCQNDVKEDSHRIILGTQILL